MRPETAASWASLGAIVASGAHVVIDFLVDLYPRTALGFTLIGLPVVAIYGTWGLALFRARGGSRGGIGASRIFALVQAALLNGLAGLFPCPPVALVGAPSPCALAPWQDLAHLGSLTFGVIAFWTLGRIPSLPDGDAWLAGTAVALLVAHVLLGGLVFVVGP